MTIPVAQAGADQDYAATTLPKTVTLSGAGTESPDSYRWTMLDVPPGSSAGNSGDFSGGQSTVQNASFIADVVGGYVLQLEAHNGDGWSDPGIDKEGAQTIVYIKTARLGLKLPGYGQYRYDADLTGTVKALETGAPADHASEHEPGGGDAMTVDAVAGTGSLRTLGTGAQQACAGSDARLSDNRTDGNAVHLVTAAEISTLTEKVAPVAADLLIIEDSAAANAKKKIQVGNLPGGSGSSPLTTKGDLYGFDSANARIPVGADGQTIVADSSQALGLKWASQVAAGLASDGVVAGSAQLSANQSITSTSPAPIPNTPLTLPVTTVAGEKLIVSFSATFVYGATQVCYARAYFDGVVVGNLLQESSVSGYSVVLSDSFPITVATPGEHTLELRVYVNTGSATIYAGITQLRATQFRGGYIQPENVPILKYNSASTIDVGPAPGADSQLRVMLIDGQRYISNAALTVNLTLSGRGGLDTGSEAASTWYYVYAVPATTAGQLAVVASVTPPGSGGPTGFSAWKYLGAIRNDGSSNIYKFTQVGNSFRWTALVNLLSGGGYAPDASYVAINASAAIPATAAEMGLWAMMLGVAGENWSVAFSSDGVSAQFSVMQNSSASASDTCGGTLSIFTPQTFYRKIVRQTGSAAGIGWLSYNVQGWTDGYLTQTVTQSQPMQTLTGSNGTQTVQATLGSNFTVSSTSFADVTGMSLSVTTVAGEAIYVSFNGFAYNSGSANSCYINLLVDGVIYGDATNGLLETGGPVGVVGSICFGRMVTGLAAGPHTVKIQAKRDTANCTIYANAVLQVTQFLGGYSNPDNVPMLAYSSASAVAIQAAPGASGTLQVTLSDGQKYTAASPLSVSLAAPSTWYYLYAVPPATVGGSFACVASVSPPSTGPTGFTGWKYLGAIYNTSTGDIKKFYQNGATFTYREGVIPAASAALGTTQKGSDTTAVDLSLADAVPPTAFTAHLQHRVQISSGFMIQHLFPDGEPVDSTAGAKAFSQAISTASAQDQWNACLIPMTPNAKVQYKCFTSGGTIAAQGVYVLGWTDGWLSQGAPQVQAKAVADTKLPRLTWVGNSSVTAAAAPGQPGTVRVTLQDGTQRSFTGSLTWDPSTGAVDGGLDTGTEAISTWYYLYLVPKSTDASLLAIRGSVTGPATGPTGYTNWAYVGAVRNHSDGHLWEFRQSGDQFRYMYSHIFWNPSSPSADGSVVTMDVSSVCPITGRIFSLQIKVDTAASGQCYQLRVGGGVDYSHHAQAMDSSGVDTAMEECFLPLKTAQQMVRRLYLAGGSGNAGYAEMAATGWIDEYLS
jgi:hypothetical protein